jgi:hypothetical protein
LQSEQRDNNDRDHIDQNISENGALSDLNLID